MNTRMAKALRDLGYTCRDAEIEESAVDVELNETSAVSLPVELREASGRILPPGAMSTTRTTGQPLPTVAELEQRMTVALGDIRAGLRGEPLTAVNRTQQPQKGATALTEVSTPTTQERLAAALRAIREGR